MEDKKVLEQKLSSEETEFKREISLFGGVSILGGIMIGGGIFYLGSYVLMRTGMSLGWALVCWALGGLISLLGGLCYAELGAMMPKAGGAAFYLNTAYHPLIGFLCGFSGWLISLPGSISGGVLALTAIFGLGGITEKLAASALIILFTLYNTFGVKGGSRFQSLTMIAKLIPIAVIMFGGLFLGKVSPNLSLAAPEGVTSVSQMISMIAFATVATLWAYEGWTNLNLVAEEVKNPKKNLPLALIISIGGIALIYILFNFAIYRVLDINEITELINSGEYYLGTVASKRLFASAGGMIVIVGMVISMIGSVNGMTIAGPRLPYAMAQEGHFFPAFGKLSEKYKVPTNALWCQCLLSLLLVWFRDLSQLTTLVVFATQFFNTLIILAVLVMRRKMPEMQRPYKVWGGAVTVIIAALINIACLVNTAVSDPVTALLGLSVPAVGAVVYFIFDKRLKSERA